MCKNSLLFSFIALFLACNTASFSNPIPNKKTHLFESHFENVLGTSLELKLYAGSDRQAEVAQAVVLREISRMAKILSGYDKNSEFSHWVNTHGKAVAVSSELYEVLDLFDKWKQRSDGALDASAEVVGLLWKQASLNNQIPTPEALAGAVAEVRQVHWKLDPLTHSATHLSQTPLMLNSFAKTYIIQHAADAALTSGGVRAVVVNIGGDLVVAGDLSETVLLSDPKADQENETPIDRLQVSNKAVATSGSYRRGEYIAGKWYSHIVDPRTAVPADDIISATVVAPRATDAGALATAFNVMSPSQSAKLAAQIQGVEYLIITKDGEHIQSAGWKNLQSPQVATAPHVNGIKPKATNGWNSDYELVISLEINLQQGGFVKRPYVAVWVEDEDHVPIRTIALWHQKDRYLPELKSWYLKYRGMYAADQNAFSTVSSATRAAGKYSIKWDGKDDNGMDVKPGKYVIKIEASREHGTYQLMRQELTCDQTPKLISVPGNLEIASATLDYRKKSNGN